MSRVHSSVCYVVMNNNTPLFKDADAEAIQTTNNYTKPKVVNSTNERKMNSHATGLRES